MNKIHYSVSISLLAVAVLFSINSGSAPVDMIEILKMLAAKLSGITYENERLINLILSVRLPRTILAICSGFSLAIVGVVFQAILRNPLADPFVLGVSSGATLGVVVAVVAGIELLAPIFGFLFALGTVIFLVAFSYSKLGHSSGSAHIILTGVILNTLFGAVIMLIMTTANIDLRKIVFLMIGNLSYLFTSDTLTILYIALILLILSAIYLLVKNRELNLLLMGSDIAQTTGMSTKRDVIILVTVSSILLGLTVSFTGPIGFVGLIIPHISRMLIGSNHKYLILFAGLNGASFLLICDSIARSISVYNLPVGVLTAVVGGIYFLYLLHRKRSYLF